MANDYRDDRWRDDDRDRFGYEGEGYIGRAGADMDDDLRRRRMRERDFRFNDYGDFNRGDYARGYGYTSATEPRPSYRGRGPKNYERSDARIHEDVCERLTYDDSVDASDMEVSVQNGIVTLNGTAHDRYQKRRAEDILESVGGVREVQNNLRVGTR